MLEFKLQYASFLLSFYKYNNFNILTYCIFSYFMISRLTRTKKLIELYWENNSKKGKQNNLSKAKFDKYIRRSNNQYLTPSEESVQEVKNKCANNKTIKRFKQLLLFIPKKHLQHGSDVSLVLKAHPK